MENTSNTYDIHKIYKVKNKSISKIAEMNIITLDKLYLDTSSLISFPKIIKLIVKQNVLDKVCTYYKDFNHNIYLQFSNYDIIDNIKFAIPKYEMKSFKCLSCNKVHSNNSSKCCSLENSIIQVLEAEIKFIYLFDEEDVKLYIKDYREEFVNLHFPDIMDRILLR
jgi:hypothetical protein